MRKKLIILFGLLFIINISNINAEDSKTTTSCTSDSNGIVTIKWTGEKQDVGELVTKYIPSEKTETEVNGHSLKSLDDAKQLCEEKRKSDPACTDPCAGQSRDKCSGSSACTLCTVEEKKMSCKAGAVIIVSESGSAWINKVSLAPYIVVNPKLKVARFVIPHDPTPTTPTCKYSGWPNCVISTKKSCSKNEKTGCYVPDDTSPACDKSHPNSKCDADDTNTQYCTKQSNNSNCYSKPMCKIQYSNKGKCEQSLEGVNICTQLSNGCWFPDDTPDETCTFYKWSYKRISWKAKANAKEESGRKSVQAAEYQIDTGVSGSTGDIAYCLQPGNKSPGTGTEYKLDSTFDISNCSDSLHRKDGKNGGYDMRCGLADILFQTVTFNSTTQKYEPNKKYSYGSITYALRMWVSNHTNFDAYAVGSAENFGAEFDTVEWVAKENYYQKTAAAIEKGTWTKRLNSNNANSVIGCGTSASDTCKIEQAVELYRHAYEASKDPSKFLNGVSFDKEVPVTYFYQYSDTSGITVVDIPESITQVLVDCTEDDYKNGKCDVVVKYYDTGKGDEITKDVLEKGKCYYYTKASNGNETTHDRDFCSKHRCKMKCEVQVKIQQKTCVEYASNAQRTFGMRIDVYIAKWQRNNGYVRFYRAKSNPNNYQTMATFAFNLEKCEETKKETVPVDETTEQYTTIQCPCDDNVKCTNLSNKEDLKSSCNSSEYTKSSISGPNMNCILNACYEYKKNEYKYTTKYSANANVCEIYCKDDLEIYLPGKTGTYAGMQFRYDLGQTLKDKGIIKETLTDDNTKLTAIVLNKRQCTSEIKYSNWLTIYNQKVDKGASEAELKNWVYELYNCNMYNQNDIPSEYRIKQAVSGKGASKDYALSLALCQNSNDCPTLTSIKYSDEYNDDISIGKTTSLKNTDENKTYYCKNGVHGACYEYKKNEAVEINAGKYNTSQTTTVTRNGKSAKVPTNDYATFIVVSESDYYQKKAFKTQASTGNVSSGAATDSSYIDLPSNSYPVSLDTSTGDKKISYSFNGIKSSSGSKYNYSCTYKVYNTTVKYDCDYRAKDGSIDLSKCMNNSSNPVKNGIPDVSNVSWTSKSNEESGAIFRNVDPGDLFPSERPAGTNWTTANASIIIKEIEKTSDELFTNEAKHLEFEVTITSSGAELIRKHNADANYDYQDATLYSCEQVTEGTNQLPMFKNCKSKFLKELNTSKYTRTGIKFSENKAGA